MNRWHRANEIDAVPKVLQHMRAAAAAAALIIASSTSACRYVFMQLPDPGGQQISLSPPPPHQLADDDAMGRPCPDIPAGDRETMARRLARHVSVLAGQIGPRSYRDPAGLRCARKYIEETLAQTANGGTMTLSSPDADPGLIAKRDIGRKAWFGSPRACAKEWNATLIEKGHWWKANTFRNVELKLEGAGFPQDSIIVGAHYDSDACESGGRNPGADDNASGVAVLIELALRIARRPQPLPRTVRFVAFSNEEEPFFWTEQMGSRKYTADLARQQNGGNVAMLSLETLGYYRDESGTQDAGLLRPFIRRFDAGNFLAFVGNSHSHDLVRRVQRAFRAQVGFPTEAIVACGEFPGVGWSDHWSFWQVRVPAVMVTDTAPKRNRCYHRDCDLPELLDYDRMALVVDGLEQVIVDLATPHAGEEGMEYE